MGKRIGCLLLVAALIFSAACTTVLAAPPCPEAAESQAPEGQEVLPEEPENASEKSEETIIQEPTAESRPPEQLQQPDVPQEPEPPTLEELRDTLMAILGDSVETQAIWANVDRMIALGDPGGALRQWLESTIRKYQIEQELEQLAGALGALEAASAELEALAQAAAELTVEPDELLLKIGEVCPTAASLLEALDEFGSAEEQRARFAAILSGSDGACAGESLTAVRLLIALKDSGLLDEAGTAAAQSGLIAEIGRLTCLCRTVTNQQRKTLENDSQVLARRANLAEPLSPVRLAVVGRRLNYTAPVFTYDGAIMLSVADAAEFLGGEVIEQGDTLIIVAPGMVLELVKGSSDGYLNDKLCKLPAPVLNFDHVYFLPLDTMLKCCGMERLTIEGYEVICQPLPQETAAEQKAAE